MSEHRLGARARRWLRWPALVSTAGCLAWDYGAALLHGQAGVPGGWVLFGYVALGISWTVTFPPWAALAQQARWERLRARRELAVRQAGCQHAGAFPVVNLVGMTVTWACPACGTQQPLGEPGNGGGGEGSCAHPGAVPVPDLAGGIVACLCVVPECGRQLPADWPAGTPQGHSILSSSQEAQGKGRDESMTTYTYQVEAADSESEPLTWMAEPDATGTEDDEASAREYAQAVLDNWLSDPDGEGDLHRDTGLSYRVLAWEGTDAGSPDDAAAVAVHWAAPLAGDESSWRGDAGSMEDAGAPSVPSRMRQAPMLAAEEMPPTKAQEAPHSKEN